MSVPVSRARRTRTRQRRAPWKSALIVAVVVVLAVLSIGGVALGVTMSSWLDDLPDYTEKGAFDVSQPTTIYSADGELLARLYLENREVIPLDEMSPYLVKGIVAVEDERFYEHNGVDILGIMRAAISTLTGSREGASTITQQYIRNTILLDERTEISLARKVREAYLAMQLEKMYTKDQILEMYLNAVYFGEGAYGAQAASKTYFAKECKDLTPDEAAMIAGIVQRPSALSPFDNHEGALKRRDLVLRRMLTNGVISQAEFDEAVAAPLEPESVKNPDQGIYKAHYFVAEVRRQLIANFSTATVFGGGLEVHTTLDTKLQKQAERAVKDKIGKKGPEGALVSIVPETGHVVAVVGGRSYKKNQFSMATQAHRQPGSSFKTFTLIAALQEGISPSTKIDSSSPAKIPTSSGTWTVNNSEGKGRGMITLASATAASVNTVFARVTEAIGADKVTDVAQAMGIKTELKDYMSVSLGAQNVTPLEMASAYATLANNGVYVEPTFITEVKDRSGEVIFEHEVKEEQVITEEVAYATTKVLRTVVTGGTGGRARLGAREVAGKTGTSQKNRDAWFVGYTPQFATAVWVGHPKEQTVVINGARAFGGTTAAPIFQQFMAAAHEGLPIKKFNTFPAPPYTSKYQFLPSEINEEDVIGKTLEDIEELVAGWKVTVKEKYSNEPEGTILGMEVNREKLTIKLIVSKGPEPAPQLPDPLDPVTPTTPPPPPPPPGHEDD